MRSTEMKYTATEIVSSSHQQIGNPSARQPKSGPCHRPLPLVLS